MKRVIVLFLLLCILPRVVSAFEGTSYTFSTDTQGEELRIVQDAYLPAGVYQTLGLKSPGDLFILHEKMLIADTGNRRVLIVDLVTGEVNELDFKFSQPVSVAADEDGRIYVADYKKNCAYRFSASGELEQVFDKPASPAYGVNNLFKPQNVAPDGNGGLYIVADGAENGIVQMNAAGEFLGFFASNSAYIALKYRIYDVFLNDNQMEKYGLGIPGKFSVLLRGVDGLIYALRAGAGCEVQKLNYKGVNLFANKRGAVGLANPVDMAMSADGSIFVLHQSGYVTQMSQDGVLLYRFSGPMLAEAREGLLQTPSGIGVDDAGNVYVLDKASGYIHIYAPTEAQKLTSKAIVSYYAGEYMLAGELLDQVLEYSSHSYYARLYRGKVYMRTGDYEAAAKQFQLAEDKEEFSEAFWEIRNTFLMENAIWIFCGVILLAIVLIVKRAAGPMQHAEYNSYMESRKLTRFVDNLRMRCIKRAIFHPVDTAYEIKCGNMGGYGPAALLLVLTLGTVLIRLLCAGFIFGVEVSEFPTAFCVLLFAVSNYFITSINDGEATLKMIFSALAYALMPLLIGLPILTLICNAMTLQEALIVNTITVSLGGLCFVTLSVMLMELHGYTVRQYLRSMILTMLFMVLCILLMSLIYLLSKQLVDFFIQVWTEVSIRE